LGELRTWLERTIPIPMPEETFAATDTPEHLVDAVMAQIDAAYAIKEQGEIPEDSRYLERLIMLNSIDNLYQAHLYNMDDLRQNVQLRSYGQRDPLVEYKQEAFKIYQTLMTGIKDAVATNLFRLQIRRQPIPGAPGEDAHARPAAPPLPMPPRPAAFQTVHQQLGQFEGTAAGRPAQPAQPQTIHRDTPKVGRNDPCPCGSGKKYKNCHGR